MQRIMKTHHILPFALMMFAFVTAGFAADQAATEPDEKERLRELDAYWAKVSRAVGEGDFEAYKSTCHELGVLVASECAQPISDRTAERRRIGVAALRHSCWASATRAWRSRAPARRRNSSSSATPSPRG